MNNNKKDLLQFYYDLKDLFDANVALTEKHGYMLPHDVEKAFVTINKFCIDEMLAMEKDITLNLKGR